MYTKFSRTGTEEREIQIYQRSVEPWVPSIYEEDGNKGKAASPAPAAKSRPIDTPTGNTHVQADYKPPAEVHRMGSVTSHAQMPPHVTMTTTMATKTSTTASAPWSYSPSGAILPPSYNPEVRPEAYTSSRKIVTVTPVPDTTPSSVTSVPLSQPSAYPYSYSSSSISSVSVSASSTMVSSTSSFPSPIFGTPIQQGPAPSTGSGAANASTKPVSALSSSKSALPGGATAGISVISILALFGLGLYAYRRWSIRKRQKLREWSIPQPYLIPPPVTEKGPRAIVKAIRRVRPPSLPLPPLPAQEPGRFDPGSELGSGMSLMTTPVPPVPPLPEMYRSPQTGGGGTTVNSGAISPPIPAAVFSPPRGARAANIRVVRCVFEPRMGDELRIRHGEALRVLAEYDDGWGYCENARGERGMIPLECLDRADMMGISNSGGEVSDDARTVAEKVSLALSRRSARKSSLPPKRT